MSAGRARRRLFAPEVVQTSSMDCGPAALKSLLEGFHIDVSYGRLREACQTGLDGTSIDTLEEVAKEGGLDAEQVMVPADHVLLPSARCLPCLAAVRSAAGPIHFIVIWRTAGPLVQVMDPARGRLWLTRSALRQQLVVHTMSVPAGGWIDWATSGDFLVPLRHRLNAIGLSRGASDDAIARAVAAGTWQALATLDAATRMIRSLADRGALDKASGSVLQSLVDEAAAAPDPAAVIPDAYWMVRPAPEHPETLRLRGAVLTRVKGVVPRGTTTLRAQSPELEAAFNEAPVRPLRELFAGIRAGGLAQPAVVLLALAAAVLGVVFEALLFRSAMDVRQMMQGPGQMLWAGAALVLFALVLLGIDIAGAAAERRLGTQLEGRFRVAFLSKLPRLDDAYFASRPIADMLERSHNVHTLRLFPRLAARFARISLELVVTAAALVWLSPGAALLAVAACAAAVLIPVLGQPLIAARDLRARTHAGALTRFHLDALRGRTAVETLGAAPAIEKEHEQLLAEWAASALSLQRTSIAIEAAQMLVGFSLAAWMLVGHIGDVGAAPLLLQAYWMLNLPALGYELALISREYPSFRTTMLRLLEPLKAPEPADAQAPAPAGVETPAASLSLDRVSVRASGQMLLDDVTVAIPPGQHVAIVGTSGAGKSTLVGLFLGWSRAASGHCAIDGAPLSRASLETLRRTTAWVDPSVRLWNAPLLDNLLYGTGASAESAGGVLEPAGLVPVVARLSDGLATPLGEGGALLSAGEAQRVRFARALLKPAPRLALLDEPFVGLERDRQRALLAHARQHWAGVTLLYVTHDLPETRGFDRVLVVDRGRIVEDGDPQQLAASPSRYRRLLQAHEAAQSRLLNGEWRRLRLENGRIVPAHARANEQRA